MQVRLVDPSSSCDRGSQSKTSFIAAVGVTALEGSSQHLATDPLLDWQPAGHDSSDAVFPSREKRSLSQDAVMIPGQMPPASAQVMAREQAGEVLFAKGI